MKTAGAFFLVMGAILLTLVRIKELGADVRETENIVSLLELMTAELSANALSIPELTAALLPRCRGSARVFVSTLNKSLNSLGEKELSDLWKNSAEESFGFFYLGDRAEFESIGTMLGRCELEMQISSLKRVSGYFRTKLERKRRELPQRIRLNLGLCTGGGLLVLIILI